ERGETDPNTNRLEQIAKIFKVNVVDFFEDSVPALKEDTGKYGYATREEMENLSKLVNSLAREIEKLRQELPTIKHNPVKRKKKRKFIVPRLYFQRRKTIL